MRGKSDLILVFVNLLAHADADGIVDRHFKAISDETGISEERIRAAITELEAPDPESRSPEQKGRRIIRLDEHRDWGWQIVNHGFYRKIHSEQSRREYRREYMQNYRKQSETPVNSVTKCNLSVTKPNVYVSASVSASDSALKLSQYMIDEIVKATGRNLITTPQEIKPWIEKLMKKEITEEQIKATIDWLCGPNLKNEACFVVQSGEKLHRRWDDIQAMMTRASTVVAPKKPSRNQIYARYLNEILLEAENTTKRPTRDEQYEYLQSCFDKYKDVPRMNGIHVAKAALMEWEERCEHL